MRRTRVNHMSRIVALLLVFIAIAAETPQAVHLIGGPSVSRASAHSSAIVDENLLPGTQAWQISTPAKAHEIEGYAGATSVPAGGSVQIFVSTISTQFHIEVYRLGWYQGLGGRLMLTTPSLPGSVQSACGQDARRMVFCTWHESYHLDVPATWISGEYLLKLVAESAGGWQSFIPVVVTDSRPSAILFQASVTTYQAYNLYGGRSLYGGSSNGVVTGLADRSFAVSFDRPYANGDGAGYELYAEFPMLRWLEMNGYDVSYTTDVDTDTSPSGLMPHKAFLSVGHDEYWSRGMRSAVEAAIQAGVSVGFFGADAVYWQIRFEPSSNGPRRVEVCYKDAHSDPVTVTQPALATTLWRAAPVSQPEQGLIGAQFTAVSNFDTPLVVAHASSWPWAGAGVQDGQHFAGLVGNEADHIFANEPVPPNELILSASPFLGSVDPADGPNGSTTVVNSTLYTAPSGARVFDAGTIYWSWGLDDAVAWSSDASTFPGGSVLSKHRIANAAIVKLTANLLDNFTSATRPTLPMAYPVSPYRPEPSGTFLLPIPVTYATTVPLPPGDEIECSQDGGVSWQSGAPNYLFTTGGNHYVECRVRAGADTGPIFASNYRSDGTVRVFPYFSTVAVGTRPIAVATDPSSGRSFIVNSGGGSISILDSKTGNMLMTVPVGANPLAVAVDGGSGKVFVANATGNTITVLDALTGKILGTLQISGLPGALAVDQNTHQLLVVNQSTGALLVYDISSGTFVASVPIGAAASALATDPNDHRVLVANLHADTVSIVNTDTWGVVATVRVGSAPAGLAAGPKGSAWVVNEGANSVSVIDVSSGTLIKTIPVGSHPSGIGIDLALNRAYVAESGTNSISVIDTSTMAVVGSVQAGSRPFAVAVDGASHHVFVPNQGDNTVTILEGVLSAGAATATVTPAATLAATSSATPAPSPTVHATPATAPSPSPTLFHAPSLEVASRPLRLGVAILAVAHHFIAGGPVSLKLISQGAVDSLTSSNADANGDAILRATMSRNTASGPGLLVAEGIGSALVPPRSASANITVVSPSMELSSLPAVWSSGSTIAAKAGGFVARERVALAVQCSGTWTSRLSDVVADPLGGFNVKTTLPLLAACPAATFTAVGAASNRVARVRVVITAAVRTSTVLTAAGTNALGISSTVAGPGGSITVSALMPASQNVVAVQLFDRHLWRTLGSYHLAYGYLAPTPVLLPASLALGAYTIRALGGTRATPALSVTIHRYSPSISVKTNIGAHLPSIVMTCRGFAPLEDVRVMVDDGSSTPWTAIVSADGTGTARYTSPLNEAAATGAFSIRAWGATSGARVSSSTMQGMYPAYRYFPYIDTSPARNSVLILTSGSPKGLQGVTQVFGTDARASHAEAAFITRSRLTVNLVNTAHGVNPVSIVVRMNTPGDAQLRTRTPGGKTVSMVGASHSSTLWRIDLSKSMANSGSFVVLDPGSTAATLGILSTSANGRQVLRWAEVPAHAAQRFGASSLGMSLNKTMSIVSNVPIVAAAAP